jgi:hypothetical protein
LVYGKNKVKSASAGLLYGWKSLSPYKVEDLLEYLLMMELTNSRTAGKGISIRGYPA